MAKNPKRPTGGTPEPPNLALDPDFPELKEISIEEIHRASRDRNTIYLLVSLDCLHTILEQEEGLFPAADIPRILEMFLTRTRQADKARGSTADEKAEREWEAQIEEDWPITEEAN